MTSKRKFAVRSREPSSSEDSLTCPGTFVTLEKSRRCGLAKLVGHTYIPS